MGRSVPSASQTCPRPPRVLVVDDEPLVRAALGRALAGAGMSVDFAADGDEALRRIDATPFDAVVSDVEMPGTDGLELARALRARRPPIPVVLLSGSTSGDYEVEAREQGVAAYLRKPAGFAAIAQAVVEALGSRQSGAA